MGSPAPASTRTAWLLLGCMILFLGVNWPVMKYGLQFIPPLHFAAARMALGGLCIGLFAAARGALHRPTRQDIPLVLGVGLLQMAAFLSLITIAVQFVPAGRSAILAYTTSLWVVPLAATFLGERLSRFKALGLLLGLGGVAILFNPGGFDWSDPKVLLGNGLLLLAAFIWAVLIVLVRGYHGRSSPLSLGLWQFALATAVLVPLALLVEDSGRVQWGTPLGLILLYNGPVATAFCYWAMLTATQALPAITTSLASLGVPVLGMLSAAVALGERITLTNSLGLCLILCGVAIVSIVDLRGRRTATVQTGAPDRGE
jgi:drug/metabolite transporter (DMT)-like permease